ncbi:MAG: peptidogalycan biosysnthesis protein [Gammaproteobacteria bacterium]|nr:peptidogalycan biosysnthesis protein [Gammaproteobacteria bacterium]MDH5802260.1 peptidogalycan biosysnthesis protein [Gammaproteobacteria bacterium]
MKATKVMKATIQLYGTVHDIPPLVWQQLDTADTGLFQGAPFLAAQEGILRQRGLQFHYAVVSEQGRACALLIFQQYSLSLNDLLVDANWFRALQRVAIVRCLSRRPIVTMIVCGDVVSTGVQGLLFAEHVDAEHRAALLEAVAERVRVRVRKRAGFGLLLLKDLQHDMSHAKVLGGYASLSLPPTMVLPIPQQWNSLNDYMASLKSKYRTRIKQIRRAAEPLQRRLLSLADLERYHSEIDALYAAVYQRAKAKGPYLGVDYFVSLRRQLPLERYQIEGYFLGQRLMAFNTRYKVNGVVESAFFGVTEQDNREYQLLKCMLVDDLEYAIHNNAVLLHLGRTNYWMKSALGAQAVACFSCYRPLNRWSSILAAMIGPLTEAEPWVACQPFRGEAPDWLAPLPPVHSFLSLERSKSVLG